jgi:hypothetical protein
MVSPHLNKKKEGQLNLNVNAKKLFQLIYVKKNDLDKGSEESSKIVVSAMVSKLSFVYEKIRNAVDYDDDHLLRKNAIKRIFKRQILIEGIVKDLKSHDLAVHLLTELIQAGYLENNSVPESKILDVSNILDKYIKLKNYCFKKENLIFSFYGKKRRNKRRTSKAQKILLNWILSLAAAEIEGDLTRERVRDEIVTDMFDILKSNIALPNNLPYEKDLDIQIYLGIARNYLSFDDDLLNFILFKYYNKNWSKIKDSEIEEVADKIDVLHLASLNQLNHPLSRQLDKIIKNYSLYFSVLQEVVEENPIKVYDQALNNYKSFINIVKEACKRRYKKIKNKLWRSGIRSIIYIFLTKSIFVFLIEIPAVKWFGEEINPFSLAINVSFPAFLLFIMILFTWAPAKENTKKIIGGIEEIVYNEKRRRNAILLRKPPKRSFFMDFLFNFLYLAGFSFTMYFIIKFLIFVQFNWVNITIFLFFLMFVSFFSFRIKREIKKFIIIEPKENVFTFLFDFMYTPIVAMGKFLSNNASRVNVFVFVLDFIIEAPFKVFVEVFDDWIKYMKERKENLVN